MLVCILLVLTNVLFLQALNIIKLKGPVIKYRGGWAMKNWGWVTIFNTLKRVCQEK